MSCPTATQRHPLAGVVGLTRREWWAAFVHEHNRRFGTMPGDLDFEDDTTRYYNRGLTSPALAVTSDGEVFGLTEVDHD